MALAKLTTLRANRSKEALASAGVRIVLNSWLHVIALVAYFGAIAGLGFVLLPAVSGTERHDQKVHLLARGLRLYNPMQVGALGILLFTGAFQLTELKAAYREMFVRQLGYPLALKLLFAFVLVILSVYQAMGIGHRLVRRDDAGEIVTPAELESCVRRLKNSNWCILFLALATLWFGLRLRS